MKLKLAPHHIAEIAVRANALAVSIYHVDTRQCATDIKAALEHIEALEEELHEAREFIASLPPMPWRAYEER